jgi:hypothetical protein
LVYLKNKKQLLFRKYSENNKDDGVYQLIAYNNLWPTLKIKKQSISETIGILIEHRRYYSPTSDNACIWKIWAEWNYGGPCLLVYNEKMECYLL